ncbi:6-carboxytetrahydropterin synthase [Candidatus Pacearchaeota archaeon]|nr:6-carboxytetrahydropterin synthase [Candidatus Pacearchaeota archaeon]
MPQEITKIMEAEIAHLITGHNGACKCVHGHSYKFEVTVCRTLFSDISSDMIIDFKDLKQAMAIVIGAWDHKLLMWKGDSKAMMMQHNLPGVLVVDKIPTAENMSTHIAEKLQAVLGEKAVVTKVVVWETSTSFATWRKS